MNDGKWIQFGAKCIRETDEALLIDVDGDEFWVPKSIVSEDSEVRRNGDQGDIEVAKWFAEKEGLV